MSTQALSGHLARLKLEGGQEVGDQLNWSMTVKGRAPNLSSGDDTSKVSGTDKWQEGDGGFTALAQKGASPIPVNFRANGTFYEYNASSVDVSSAAITDIVTVDGIAYTKAAANDVVANEWADAAGLVLAINNFANGGGANFRAETLVDVVTIEGVGKILVISRTEVVGTIVLTNLDQSTTSEVTVQECGQNPDQDSGDRQERAYTYECSGPIVDQDGELR